MGRLDKMFQSTPAGEGRLVCYLMAGDPDPHAALHYAQEVLKHADALEIGVPFSDPVADGPVIARAGARALEKGASPADAFGIVAALRKDTEKPLLVMTYYNPIFQVGLPQFARLCRATGVDGVIVPDLPVEESAPLRDVLAKEGVDLVQLVAPSTPPERLKRIGEATRGFLYVVSSYGVTGARTGLSPEAVDLTERARAACPGVPVAVGFGVSSHETATGLWKAGADAVIVGSALVKQIEEGKTPAEVGEFVRRLKQGDGP